jgi:hypothetical protein
MSGQLRSGRARGHASGSRRKRPPNAPEGITAGSGFGNARTLHAVPAATSSRLETQCVKPLLTSVNGSGLPAHYR